MHDRRTSVFVFLELSWLIPQSLGETRFSSYHLTYEFQRTYRLQTLVSIFKFKHTNGAELHCGMAKITPDIGRGASLAFTLTPLCLLVFVALASWRTHLSGTGFRSFLDHDSALANQGPIWATVLDITVFLRYLQFIFLSASMTVEYPGFYVPVVSRLAWATLLFWRGPLHYGHSSPGVEGGMYVSNATYGPDFMNQMLGYPNMLNTLGNSVINLVILVTPAFFLLSFLFFSISRQSQAAPPSFWTISKKAGVMTLGFGLCFFSVPLLSYMAYDLILIGYLPDYRIALAVIMLLIIVGANYFLTNQIDGQLQYSPMPIGDGNEHPQDSPPDARKFWEAFYRHLPYSLPLLQAIGTGSLQDHPVGQLSVLAGTEVLTLLHSALKADEPFFASTTTYCSFMRLIAALLSNVFISSATETIRQWTGYIILALHGLVVLPGFFIKSSWHLYQTFRRAKSNFEADPLDRDNRPSYSTTVRLVHPKISLKSTHVIFLDCPHGYPCVSLVEPCG